MGILRNLWSFVYKWQDSDAIEKWVIINDPAIKDLADSLWDQPIKNLTACSLSFQKIAYYFVFRSIDFARWHELYNNVFPLENHVKQLVEKHFVDFDGSEDAFASIIDGIKKDLPIFRPPLVRERIMFLEEIRGGYRFIRDLFSDINTNEKMDLEEWMGRLCSEFPSYGSDPFLHRASCFFLDITNHTSVFFDEINYLPLPVGNKITATLKKYGCLEFSTDLQDHINSHIPIPCGSPMEIALRMAGIWVGHRLTEITGSKLIKLYDVLDNEPVDKPSHLCITTHY